MFVIFFFSFFQIYVSPQLSLASMAVVPSVAILAIIYGRYIKKVTANVQGSLASATNVSIL